MRFTFDPVKSASNREKHGIDFTTAQELWEDADFLEIPARSVSEARWLIVGRINGRTWAAIVTRRAMVTRIISVRRARPDEENLYEGT